ncbi:MAG TPA: PEP-CTERM sorting domain-containing protein [Aliidongia sp.]|uniref:PEP-CTERM sorting domain-containing protein n=1 Tax=Aliidongia sp. TaxID=1914230 RepID=UPI002DDD745F|nr:PEP-CTERM sorting domain-containing protein [Aliidongia sp.]HEV2675022.1 PEP-CTERM sorting domain-containing protein [Aliidongia sp.]
MRKSMIAIATLAGWLLAHTPAHAAYIVDTGANPSGEPWDFADFQYFAGEFTIGQSDVVTGVQAYLGDQSGHSGFVTAEILSDAGGEPGSILYSDTFILPLQSALNWYGVSGLDWGLMAGSYWLTFVPDANIFGTWPDGVPDPMEKYASKVNGLPWASGREVGERIAGAPLAVPEPGSIALLAAGLMGLFVLRSRRHCSPEPADAPDPCSPGLRRAGLPKPSC